MTPREVVEAVYQRFGDGDIDGFLALCAQDVEWVVNGPATLEKCRAFRGRDGVRGFVAILQRTWVFSTFVPREFIVAGDTVVVLGEESGEEQGSGVRFENRWAHVFELRDGRVTRFREFLCHWPGDQRPPAMSW